MQFCNNISMIFQRNNLNAEGEATLNKLNELLKQKDPIGKSSMATTGEPDGSISGKESSMGRTAANSGSKHQIF